MIPAARSHVGAIAVLAAVVAGLVALDKFLVAMQDAELGREARSEYAAGVRAMESHQPEQAAVHFERAHSLVRTNRGYQLALGEAWAEAGQFERAEREIGDVLDEDSNDAAANLAMARLSARLGRTSDADAYYHRAIYGSWRGDANARRTAARVELAQFLAAQHRREELLSESLILQTDAAGDPKIADRVAGWLLEAGSAGRAVAAYTEILKQRPDDAAALRGLAEAQLAAGDYRHAEASWLKVVRSDPGDATAAKKLQFAAALEQMDPTPRRLRTSEKLRRSEALLDAVRNRVAACGGAAVPTQTASAPPPKAAAKNEDAETVISEAEKLWASRPAGCPVAADDPVAVLIAKLGAS